MDVLCLMFDCEERGVLESGGTPWNDAEICFAIGGDFDATLACLGELFKHGVLRKNASGAYYSARLMRDEHIRQVRSENGVKGGKKSGKKRRSKTKAKHQAKSKLIPEDEDEEDYSIPIAIDTSEFRTVLAEFAEYRKQIDKPLTTLARKKLLNRLEKYGVAVGIEAMNLSIENGWQGVFPDKVSIPATAASRLPTAEDDAAWSPYGIQ